MGRTIQRAFLIVVLGCAVGMLSNAILPKGVPLITPPKKAPKADEFVPLEKAREIWSSGTAFFLDARKPEDYNVEHIANALNLPVEEFEQYFPKIAPMLGPDSSIVVYCDGTECELSHRLAEQMRQQGFTNVHMLFNGMTAWRAAQFPTEPGASP